jgi:serine/threonine-protein kinase
MTELGRSDDRSHGSSSGGQVELGDLPSHIGPYRILRLLGQGGMGVVYLAQQEEPVRREVAIKVLKTGTDSELVVARFDTERQALAVMEHPGITKVFDAGISAGRWPYFVMENVSGVPLIEYADAHRLSIADRIGLIIQVCRAVQHAHQKGIIHRDLKPSNILVTDADGPPLCKVIDFGIAKATGGVDQARLTVTGLAIGTPAYMSPEQALGSGLDIDTRADIYSLGVVLYELLAGVLPYDPARMSSLALIAQHASVDARSPSSRVAALPQAEQASLAALRQTDAAGLRRALAGDLDWITLQALEKERERRYQTAISLAEDLERHLADRPVSAGPPSGAYRVGKFVRRHRAGVTLTATVAVLLVGSSIAVSVQARRAQRARVVAEQRQVQAEELISFMLGDLRTRLSAIGGLDILSQVGKKAQDYFAAVPETELSDAEQFRRSEALRQIGDVRVQQGDFAGAMGLFRQSLALAGTVARRNAGNADWQLGLGASHFWVGFIHWRHNDLDSALAEFTPYLRITQALVARWPDSLRFRNELGQASSNIGSVKEAQGDLAGALAAYREAIAAKEFTARADTTKLDWRLGLADGYNAAAVVQRKLGDLAGAERMHRAELAEKLALVAHDPPNKQYQSRLAAGYSFLGELLMTEGHESAALQELTASRELYRSLVAADSTNTEMRRFLATVERQRSTALLESGDVRGALREIEPSRVWLDPKTTKIPNNAVWQLALARTLAARADALSSAGRGAEAAASAQRAIDLMAPALSKKPSDQNLRVGLADSYLSLGAARAGLGDLAGARTAWKSAWQTVDSLARATRITDQLALDATALLRLDQVAEARPMVDELLRRGYRRPRWMALVRQHNMTLSS